MKIVEKNDEVGDFLLNSLLWSGAKECKLCRSPKKMLKNTLFLAIRNVHTAENETCEVCSISVDRSPRSTTCATTGTCSAQRSWPPRRRLLSHCPCSAKRPLTSMFPPVSSSTESLRSSQQPLQWTVTQKILQLKNFSQLIRPIFNPAGRRL